MLQVLYTHCQRCRRRLREPVAQAPSRCHSCYLLSSVELPWRLPEIPRDEPLPLPVPTPRRTRFTEDDFADMERRGEYFDESGTIYWRQV